MRGATRRTDQYYNSLIFQPTRPLRGATNRIQDKAVDIYISTHAPLAGRDTLRRRDHRRGSNFNPRAPCGARRIFTHALQIIRIFQPTRPLRGATFVFLHDVRCIDISTHAPLAGRDRKDVDFSAYEALFQPTRPLRGATPLTRRQYQLLSISTHAPLAGRDARNTVTDGGSYISTHAPLAGRDVAASVVIVYIVLFQPTRPLRGATAAIECYAGHRQNFNPRAPCGARQARRQDRPC